MPSIAPISSKLTLNTATYMAGLARARKAAVGVGKDIGKVGLKVAAFGAATATAAAAGIAVMVSKSMSNIDSLAKTSDKLGMATEDLARLRYASELAGVGAEGLDKGLEKMTVNLGLAAQGTGTAQAAIAELGLDSAKLASESPDQAFRDIADAVSKVPSATDKARIAYQIFGKQGVSMVNMLNQGRAGLEAAGKEADKFGLSVTRIDAAKIEAANDSMTRAKSVFEGAANTLAVQLAPFIEAAATKFVDMATSGEGMGKRIINAFEWVVTGVAKAADWLELLRSGFYTLRSGAMWALAGIVNGIGGLADAANWLLDTKLGRALFGGAKIDTTFIHAFGQGLEQEAKDAWKSATESYDRFATGANSAAVTKVFDDIRAAADVSAKAIADNAEKTRGAAASTEDWAQKLKDTEANAKNIDKILTDLQTQLDTFGMSDSQKKLFDLQKLGADPTQIAQATAAIDKLKSLKKAQDDLKSMQDDAKSIFDSTRTPLEKYETTIDKLGKMLDAGVLDWDTYGRAVRDARAELEKTGKADAPSMIVSGSAQAQRIAFAAANGLQSGGRDDIPKKQLTTQERMARSLEGIERKIEPSTTTTVEEVDI